MDLDIIIFIQIIASNYGLYSIAQGRPVWLAYYVNRFQFIRNNEIIEKNIEKALSKYQNPSWCEPQCVGVEFAQDKQTYSDDYLLRF